MLKPLPAPQGARAAEMVALWPGAGADKGERPKADKFRFWAWVSSLGRGLK